MYSRFNENLCLIQDPDHRGKGTSNGVFQNHHYFTCKNDCGLFISLDKLSPHDPSAQDERLGVSLQNESHQYHGGRRVHLSDDSPLKQVDERASTQEFLHGAAGTCTTQYVNLPNESQHVSAQQNVVPSGNAVRIHALPNPNQILLQLQCLLVVQCM